MSGGDGIGVNVILQGGLEVASNELLIGIHTIATNPF